MNPKADKPVSRTRLWSYRLVAAAIPLVVIGLVEGGLRLGGYGYETGFWVRDPAGRGLVSNERFSWRYLGPVLARAPVETLLAAPKPAGTVRVVVLGESAARGIPDPMGAWGPGRILEVMLSKTRPGTRFDVVNAAVTAVNSHAMLDAARDAVAIAPDVFVVYAGNNEVVGPFGPGSVFQGGAAPARLLVRASVALRSLRLGQLADDLARRLATAGEPGRWGGMGMFVGRNVAFDDPRMERVYASFRENLRGVCDAARDAGAAVVLVTVATSLADGGPFASGHRPGLDADATARFDAAVEAGRLAADRGDNDDALARFASAEAIDPSHADLQYRIGRLLLRSGRKDEAARRFVLARDLDALRFRADSRLNGIVREVAAERAGDRVSLADAAAVFDPLAAVPGSGLLWEHVHLTFDGKYLLARTILGPLDEALPANVRAVPRGGLPSIEECGEALAHTLPDRFKGASDMAEMTAAPPFDRRSDHAEQRAALLGQVEKLAAARTPVAMAEALDAYARAIRGRPDDWILRANRVLLPPTPGDAPEVEAHARFLIANAPFAAPWHLALADALGRQGRFAEAEAAAREGLRLDPGVKDGHIHLALVLESAGRTAEAVEAYRAATRADPGSAQAWNDLGASLASSGDRAAGIDALNEAIRLAPGMAEAWFNLGRALEADRRPAEARRALRQALDVAPWNVRAALALADHARREGRPSEALDLCARAAGAGSDPGAHSALARALTEVGQPGLGLRALRRARDLAPPDSPVEQERRRHNGLVARIEEASSREREAVASAPSDPGAHARLAAALEAAGRHGEASASWRDAIRVGGGIEPRLRLAALAATSPDPAAYDPGAALVWAEEAAALAGAPAPGGVSDVLATALAAAGRVEEAAEAADRAYLAALAGRGPAEDIGWRADLFRRGEAYRLPAVAP